MSMVRCCTCNKPMDTDAPGSIYADGEDLCCLGCFGKLKECGLCDRKGSGDLPASEVESALAKLRDGIGPYRLLSAKEAEALIAALTGFSPTRGGDSG